MSAKTEQYRERLRSIGFQGMLASDFPTMTGGQFADGFEAVAAQVLRDLLDAMRDDMGMMSTVLHAKDISKFAAERGIDLDGDA